MDKNRSYKLSNGESLLLSLRNVSVHGRGKNGWRSTKCSEHKASVVWAFQDVYAPCKKEFVIFFVFARTYRSGGWVAAASKGYQVRRGLVECLGEPLQLNAGGVITRVTSSGSVNVS